MSAPASSGIRAGTTGWAGRVVHRAPSRCGAYVGRIDTFANAAEAGRYVPLCERCWTEDERKSAAELFAKEHQR